MSPLILMSLTFAADAPARTVVAFDVKPMPAPRPALKYQLLPTPEEIETGAAMPLYLKCFMEQTHFYANKESIDDRERWQKVPLRDLPLGKVRNYGGWSLRYADQAARVSTIDFQIIGDIRKHGAFTLLPDIQMLRTLAAALKVRLRGEIAEKRFDDAVGTVKTLFKLGHQLGEHPTLIGNLVGLAIVSLTTTCLEEMVQEGGPNLYWALTNLPQPLVSLRAGAQAERLFFLVELNRLERDGPTTPARLEKALAGFERLLKAEGLQNKVDLRGYVTEHARKPDHVMAARKRLVEYGLKPDAVKAMTPEQVVLLDEQRVYEERIDGITKWLTLPYWRAAARVLDAEKGKGGVLSGLLPQAHNVLRAQARADQRLKMLRVLEALRLHAAAHRGQLPANLDEVYVPLPADPVTGRPFAYAVEGGKAVIRGAPPKGEEKSAAYNVVYEVKVK